MTLLTEQSFSESSAQIGGAHTRIIEAGSGAPVLVLGAGFAGSAAHSALARRFHVIAFEVAENDPKKAGDAAASWIASKKFEKTGLLGVGTHASAALWAASAAGEAVNALVLVSPRGLPLGESQEALKPLLKEVLAPKCVLIGTLDAEAPNGAVALFKKNLSRANVVLVFDAGADICADRPEAFANVAGDFFDRQGRFGLATESVAISD